MRGRLSRLVTGWPLLVSLTASPPHESFEPLTRGEVAVRGTLRPSRLRSVSCAPGSLARIGPVGRSLNSTPLTVVRVWWDGRVWVDRPPCTDRAHTGRGLARRAHKAVCSVRAAGGEGEVRAHGLIDATPDRVLVQECSGVNSRDPVFKV